MHNEVGTKCSFATIVVVISHIQNECLFYSRPSSKQNTVLDLSDSQSLAAKAFYKGRSFIKTHTGPLPLTSSHILSCSRHWDPLAVLYCVVYINRQSCNGPLTVHKYGLSGVKLTLL